MKIIRCRFIIGGVKFSMKTLQHVGHDSFILHEVLDATPARGEASF